MLLMSTRLEQVYPDVAARLQALPSDRQSRLVQQVALDAARSTGLPAPPPGRDLAEWSDAVDSQGWSRDAEGEWRQAEDDFARARAAAALCHASQTPSRTDAAEDSLYESTAALGLDAVVEQLDPGM